MPRYFTHYWDNQTFREEREERSDAPLDSLSGSQFRSKTMRAGDIVYVITVLKGRLFVVGKLEVGRICDAAAAAAALGSSIDELADRDEFVIAAAATPVQFDVEVPIDLVARFRFIRAAGPREAKMKQPDQLDEQTLRGVCELSEWSATQLDRYLPEMQPR